MSLLAINDVIKLYKPNHELDKSLQVPALRGVNLEINPGELCSVIGPSGSGKTTLLKLIAGIEKPSSGSLYMEGIGYINQLSNRQIRKYRQETIGFMYQHPESNLLDVDTALNNVTFPMRILGKLNREQRRKKALQLLELVGLKNRRNHQLGSLSGGEAQRVAIAISLANDPSLVLADEPTGELDTENTFKIIETFKTINQDQGTSFLVVTHDSRFSNLTENTYKLKDGRISGFHRFADEFKVAENREDVYLIDQFGNLVIPDHILKEMNFGPEVRLVVKKEKDLVEIVPIRTKNQEELL